MPPPATRRSTAAPAARLFGQVDAVQQLTDEIRSGHSGSLTIASVASLSATIVAAAISRFSAVYPKVSVGLRAQSTRQVLESITNHQVDLGVIDVPEGGPDMEAVEPCSANLGCAMPAGHRLAALQTVSAADLEQEVLIPFAEDTRLGCAVREALRKRNTHGRITFSVNQTFSAHALAQAGAGVALVDPFPLLMGKFPQLVIRALQAVDPDPSAHPGEQLSPDLAHHPVSSSTCWPVAEEFTKRSANLMRRVVHR